MRVTLIGWEGGRNTIDLTQYLCSQTGWSLAQAKQATDDLCFGKQVVAEFPETSNRLNTKIDLLQLGVKCEIA